ncbi:MAG: hypothetical protein Q7J34_01375 [Bacteroidales bacterium]|nr:hypothetical protein [Bacteroidales bacterium]
MFKIKALILLIFFPVILMGQFSLSEGNGHWVFGGNIGARFGAITQIDVSPSAAYQFNRFLLAGTGLTYQYYYNGNYTPPFSTHIFGSRVFTQVYPIPQAFGHAEFEMLNIRVRNKDDGREWVPSLLLGGGYNQAMGSGAYASFMILWDVIRSANSPYENPIIRVGFGIRL